MKTTHNSIRSLALIAVGTVSVLAAQWFITPTSAIAQTAATSIRYKVVQLPGGADASDVEVILNREAANGWKLDAPYGAQLIFRK